MTFNKKTYVDGVTVISAENLNDIQDEILRLGGASAAKTAGGTVVSQNADFAEVAEWADGNPDNEDRTGYFVCANVPVNGIIMRKATSLDDVKGVSILAPAFAGNYSKDKLDENGNLLPKYSFVAIIGFVPVIDNGTCTVGGRCMPDDNGCAIPSSNSMGYQVVNRIDENRVLIIIEPNGDMVQRIKTKVKQLEEEIAEVDKLYVGSGEMPEGYDVQIDPEGSFDFEVDQNYDSKSTNPQSGVAVAEAVKGKANKENWELIESFSVKEEAVVERIYTGKYKKILVRFYSNNNVPRVRLLGNDYLYWEFYTYSNHASINVDTFGEIVIPKILSDVYATVGNNGGNAYCHLPVIDRVRQPAEYFNGFKTDAVCKANTNITVYGVKA